MSFLASLRLKGNKIFICGKSGSNHFLMILKTLDMDPVVRLRQNFQTVTGNYITSKMYTKSFTPKVRRGVQNTNLINTPPCYVKGVKSFLNKGGTTKTIHQCATSNLAV